MGLDYAGERMTGRSWRGHVPHCPIVGDANASRDRICLVTSNAPRYTNITKMTAFAAHAQTIWLENDSASSTASVYDVCKCNTVSTEC